MDEWMNEKPNLETDPELNSMCLGFRVSKMRGGEGGQNRVHTSESCED